MKKRSLLALVLVFVLAAAFPAAAQEDAVLIGNGQTEIELGLTYSHYSNNYLNVNGFNFFDVLFIGRMSVDKIERDSIIPTVTLRQSLGSQASAEITVPFKYRVDDTYQSVEGTMEKITKESGIGDVEIQLNLQPTEWSKPDSRAAIVLGAKIPTGLDPYEATAEDIPLGTGHWGAKAGVSLMKQIDPVVLFGGLTYYENCARVDDELGSINPGNTWQYQVGMAFAINNRISFNTRLEQGFTGMTTVDDVAEPISDSNAATLYFGGSYVLESGRTIDLTVGAGLTDDAPDISVKIAYPIRF